MIREENGHKVVIDVLAIFRDGISPAWEDRENKHGGHFQLTIKPNLPAGQVDELWNNIVLGVVSGAVEPTDMITGIRMVDKLDHKLKPNLRFEIWFNAMDEEGSNGKMYDLRGSLERCIRVGIDGSDRPVTWGRTETKSHRPGGK